MSSEHFVVRHYVGDSGPSIKGNGFDGLRIGDTREEAEEFVKWINYRIDKIKEFEGAFGILGLDTL